MTNEQYLVVSYFVVLLVVTPLLGLSVYGYLRRPFTQIADALPRPRLAAILKRALPTTLLLAALAGFFAVSYRSCGESYQKIVSNRKHLAERNRAQVASVSRWLTFAVLAWGLMVLLMLIVRRRALATPPTPLAAPPSSSATTEGTGPAR